MWGSGLTRGALTFWRGVEWCDWECAVTRSGVASASARAEAACGMEPRAYLPPLPRPWCVCLLCPRREELSGRVDVTKEGDETSQTKSNILFGTDLTPLFFSKK